MNDPLYRTEILEHYRNPQNFGRLKKPTMQAYMVNPLCGDEIDLQIQLGRGNRVQNVAFSGSGCALSIASASLFTERLKGKTLKRLNLINPGQVVRNLAITISPARKKCVLLPYSALQEILKQRLNTYAKQKNSPGKTKRNSRS